MTVPDPFVLTLYIFSACILAGFGLTATSKNHPKIGGALMMSGGVAFLMLANYCLYCITASPTVIP
jgi:hypothetical protein